MWFDARSARMPSCRNRCCDLWRGSVCVYSNGILFLFQVRDWDWLVRLELEESSRIGLSFRRSQRLYQKIARRPVSNNGQLRPMERSTSTQTWVVCEIGVEFKIFFQRSSYLDRRKENCIVHSAIHSSLHVPFIVVCFAKGKLQEQSIKTSTLLLLHLALKIENGRK